MKLQYLNAVLLFVTIGISGAAQSRIEPVPKNVDVAYQPDSPVRLTLLGVHRMSEEFQPLGFSITNSSEKAIRSLVVAGLPGAASMPLITGSIILPGGEPGHIGGNAIKAGQGEKWTISVDSVLYADGGTWGPNATGDLDSLLGYHEGQRAAVAEVRALLELADEAVLANALSTDPIVKIRPVIESRGEKWRIGYTRGYGSLILTARFDLKEKDWVQRVITRLEDTAGYVEGVLPRDPKRKLISKSTSIFEPPVQMLGLRLGEKSIAFDKWLTPGSDWLKGFAVKFKNTSGKSIKYFSLNMEFPETKATGNLMVFTLWHGRPIVSVAPITREVDPPIPPGAVFELVMDDKRLGQLKRFLEERDSLDSLTRVNIDISIIHFDDDTAWSLGTTMRRDPNDPKRLIPVKTSGQ